MKILYIANRAEDPGGGQISLLEFLAVLDKSRFSPAVLCPGEGIMAEKIRSMGIKVYLWDMPGAKGKNIRDIKNRILTLRSTILEYGAHIVHTNGIRAQFYASLAVRGTSSDLIWHVRESIRDRFLYDWFLALLSDRIICVSEAVARKRFKYYPGVSEKIEVVYNGVDTNKFYRDKMGGEAIRKEFFISDMDILIGTIGLLVPLKGHMTLFDAVKILVMDFPGIKVLVLGKAADEEYLLKLQNRALELGIKENVIFSEPRMDIRRVLSALDVFILPSSREGSSRALLEAMACSVPIAASDVDGNNETIVSGESGILFPYGDSKKLASSIKELILDKENAKKMAEKGRERVLAKFSIEKHADSIQYIYKGLRI